ncbi:NAD(P)/FAD-dependent oxidoreductase [Saccharopolyspora shandongensis]|uniref:NAD(P)/FAD-dependent oxidoreductase n=1 Tax=Saccharopolyspora shandongensis TaxID=418495 RepID=UPI0033D16C89
MYSRVPAPRRVVVVGAGVVGLSTAWFLQERGVEVVVLDRSGVAAGASWGNAGWLTPSLATPLGEPSVLVSALRSLGDPNAALHVPLRPDPAVLAFLARFAARCTPRAWQRSMAALVPVNRLALQTFDELTTGGVRAGTHSGPILVGFADPAHSAALRHELEQVSRAGLDVRWQPANPTIPQLSERIVEVLELHGQRYLEPGPFVQALAESVRDRGGRIVAGARVRAMRHGPGGIAVETFAGAPEVGDAVVVATGSWLPELARKLGVRAQVQAGRGYSFSVPTDEPAETPVYFPAAKVACTPYQGRLRIAGTMEFRGPDDPLQPGRVDAIVRSVKPLLSGVDWSDAQDVWVGPRPMTPDGLPLLGATKAPGIFVAGGHGMWGVTLGPISGKLLAERIVTGTTPPELRPFGPLR